jgi:hypothetical protein
MSQLTDFKTELKTLLIKHNATISFACNGDTHGMSDDKLIVQFYDKAENKRSKQYKLADGWNLQARDVK